MSRNFDLLSDLEGRLPTIQTWQAESGRFGWRRIFRVPVLGALLRAPYSWFAARSSAKEDWSDLPSAIAPASLQGTASIEREQFVPQTIAQIQVEPVVAPTGAVGVVGGTLDGESGGVASFAVPASPSSKPFTPTQIPVGGQLEAAKLSQPRTEYPRLAGSANIQGLVRMEAVISKDGTIQQLKVLSGHPIMLVKATQQALQSWRCPPTLLNGESVESVAELAVNFGLKDVQ